MAPLIYILSCCFALVLHLATASPQATCLDGACEVSRRDLSVGEIAADLGPQLSKTSSVFGDDDPRWENATIRFQALARPAIKLVVQPGEEGDVAIIVKYANKNSIAFMATNRRHSLTMSVAKFSGIEIDLSLLRALSINDGERTATLQGGAYSGDVWSALWDKGFVTTTGSAPCVGLMGPGLGGGHGRWQGHFGLVSDNFVKLNTVLADGTTITISDTSHPDLFWAMKGAGHNFGVVTSYEMKIYDRGPDTWYYKIYVWNQTQLETVFQTLNTARGTFPKKMAVNYGIFAVNASISTTEPVIWWSFVYIGSKEEAQKYLTPFDDIEQALDVQEGEVPYPDIAEVTLTGESSGLCTPGYSHNHATIYLKKWNATAQRQVFDLYRAQIRETPLWANTFVVMEDYAHEGVAAVDAVASAYPWRDYTLLSYINVGYLPNAPLDAPARDWALRTRDLWLAGQQEELSTYVNYARGEEPLGSMYGYEPWRLERLRALKARYDPHGRFGYYNPIIPLV